METTCRLRSAYKFLLLLPISSHDALDSRLLSLVIISDITGTTVCVWHRRLLDRLEQLEVTGDWRLVYKVFQKLTLQRRIKLFPNSLTA